MRPVRIESAKQISKACDARGCVVFVFSDCKYSMASYGRNKEDCQAMKVFGDALAELMESGDLPEPVGK